MTWRRLALLLAVSIGVAAGGCDGGSSGTGITTAQGNVASIAAALGLAGGMNRAANTGMVVAVASSMHPAASDSLEGIQVSVEGTQISGETNAQGFFHMSGDFDSDVTFLFERASDGLSARLRANVPAGGTLTMNDVHIDTAQGVAVPQKEDVEFAGLISSIDCPGERLVLVSAQKPTDGDQYVVVLAGSTVKDANGAPVSCDALKVGESAQTSAIVNPDGTFGDADIVVGGS